MMQQMLFAGGGDTISLLGVSYYGTRVGVACTVQYQLTSAAAENYIDENSNVIPIGTWCVPTANAGNYESRMTLTSGTFTTGTVATWEALSSTRTWSVTQSVLGVKTTTATIEIRDVATSTVRATATVDLTAERA
jgi:hypothetical protein